jgi:predicted MFS family arabinose efflux permease
VTSRYRTKPRRDKAGSFTLRILICLILALETTTYGLISPLLPGLVEQHALPSAQVGLITGAYTTGMLPACVLLILGGRFLSARATVLSAIISLCLGCLTLANVPTFAGLLIGRFLLGFGSGLAFGGGIRLLVKTAPGRESLFFGLGFGMLSVGTAVGPLIGALALEWGSDLVHNILAGLFMLCLLALASLHAARSSGNGNDVKPETNTAPFRLLGRSEFLVALAPMVVPALAIGILFTLVPLILDANGNQAWVAGTFAVSAVVGAGSSVAAGHFLGRVAAGRMSLLALGASVVLFAVLSFHEGAVVVALATIGILGVTNQAVVVAAGEQLRRACDRLRVADVSATFVPLVFAVFETVGAVLSGKAADLASALPFAATAIVAAACLLASSIRSEQDHPAEDRRQQRALPSKPRGRSARS